MDGLGLFGVSCKSEVGKWFGQDCRLFNQTDLVFKTVGSLAPKLDKQSVSSILTHFPWTQRFELVFFARDRSALALQLLVD